ncbi:hypothetical protein TCAL_01574 [Tigriopus californicus]|uniref:alpha-1,2-Mannosidase n=2 Tax=Tigriopus californicus TaxID=6832 RepID=A0A553P709_TIGCA|nr:hypothetical protein TCAL_01574 [Tigriopus californicus]
MRADAGWWLILPWVLCLGIGLAGVQARGNVRTYTPQDLERLREDVRSMFQHAYQSYLDHAYPYDELRPLSCDGVDTWGSYSLTLIDALDTLAVMGNYSEFRRVYALVAQRPNFDADINVSVFETNIRIVGGLVAAHLMAQRAGAPLEPGWPCAGPLLRLAEDVGRRLLPAFNTETGMPYGTVNLRHGVPSGETPITCTAGVSTFIVEFGALSHLTGQPIFEATAMRALRALFYHRSPLGLMGNHIDVQTGKWTATDSGIGAGVDSYYEYLVKGAQLLQRPELMHMFKVGQEAIDQHMRHDDWHFWVGMKQGAVTMPVFQSLEAFWPGTLSLIGENMKGLKSLHNYHQIWKQYGFMPEFYNVPQGQASSKREGYPLRPEHIESIMYLYRATKDPFLLQAGEDILRSIEHSARTECGYATVKDVRDHTLEDRMESFFLAETTKYLYLLFDTNNWIHNPGNTAQIHETPHGKCVLNAGGYIFNTEAHPIDPAALKCCSSHSDREIKDFMKEHLLDVLEPESLLKFQGDLVPARIQQIQAARDHEMEQRRQRKQEYLKRIEDQRLKERLAIKRKRELDELRKAKTVEYQSEKGDNAEIPLGQGTVEVVQIADLNVTAGKESPGQEVLEVPYEEEANDNEIEGKVVRVNEMFEKEDSPEFQTHTPQITPVKEETTIQGVLIKRQSKDEAIEELQPQVTTKGKNFVNTLTDVLKKLLPTHGEDFDLDEFTRSVMDQKSYVLNQNWYQDHFVMACPAQSFLERFSLQGEFFEDY